MIAVFSGTGNSLHVAGLLHDALGDRVVSIADADLPDAASEERVVWVFPVYSWGVPPVVCDYMRSRSAGVMGACDHYAVMTCGDDVGRADVMWRRLVRKCGGRPRGAWSVQMPNTYVLMKGFDVDSPEVEQSKLDRVESRVRDIADAIRSAPDTVDVVAGSFARIKTSVIYSWFRRYAMSPRPFHALAGCTGCGTCARSCPLGNISMRDRLPQWGPTCALCLRCYHVCPHHCVAYGKATDGKGQYRHFIGLTAKKGR